MRYKLFSQGKAHEKFNNVNIHQELYGFKVLSDYSLIVIKKYYRLAAKSFFAIAVIKLLTLNNKPLIALL